MRQNPEEEKKIFSEDLLKKVRERKPLIHCITNYVTANDVANVLLALGASPIMADCPEEAGEITALSQGLVLNMGTISSDRITSMKISGRRAFELGLPVVLDPVGAGSSVLRLRTVSELLSGTKISAIRGNASEIKALCGLVSEGKPSAWKEQGVDSRQRDALQKENFEETIQRLKNLSRLTGACVVMTGKEDLIIENEKICLVRGGSSLMGSVTGTGCMMDGVLAALLSVSNKGEGGFGPAVLSCAFMKAAACRAYEKTRKQEGGTGLFRVFLIDAIGALKTEDLKGGIEFEF